MVKDGLGDVTSLNWQKASWEKEELFIALCSPFSTVFLKVFS